MGSWGGARDPEGTALTPVEEEGSGTQFPVTWVGGIPFSISVVTCRVDHHSHARPQGRTSRGWPEVLALYPLGFLLILKMQTPCWSIGKSAPPGGGAVIMPFLYF